MTPDNGDATSAEPSEGDVVTSSSAAPARATTAWTELHMHGNGLYTLSPTLYTQYNFLTSLRVSNNRLTTLPPAIRKMRSLVLLDLSNNKITKLPAELGLLVSLQSLYLHSNLLRALPVEFGNLHQLTELTMEGNMWENPFHMFRDKSVIAYLRDQRKLPPPGERPWRQARGETGAAPEGSGDGVTVLTWNILADKMATSKQYGYCPEWALAWDHRKGLILKEILKYDPDLVCLQEVEGQQFHYFFLPELRNMGYDGLYRPKARARTMPSPESMTVDGCAIFFKSSKFSLIEERVLEFSTLITTRPDVQQAPDLLNRVMPNDNIAVVAKLQHLGNPRRSLLLANVHLTWHPDMADVRLIQTAMLCDELRGLAFPTVPAGATITDNTPQLFPVLLCGDLNALPDSGAHALLQHGHINAELHPELTGRQYGNAYTAARLTQAFKLTSAHIAVADAEPAFTNHTTRFTDTLDYIFVDKSGFDTVAALGTVSPQDLEWRVGFPDQHFPSDHVPQVARLRWKIGTGRDFS